MGLSLIAAILTTSALVPQVVKAYRTREVGAISLAMYCVQLLGMSLWIVHGVRMHDISLILANSVTSCLAVAVVIAKLKFGKTEKQK